LTADTTPTTIPKKSQMMAAPIASEDVLLARVRDELAGEQLVHHLVVLDVERPVEAPVVADVDDVLLRRILAGDALRRVTAGDDDEDHEDDERHRDDDENGAHRSSDEEVQHQC
jgi:hypothetical protein